MWLGDNCHTFDRFNLEAQKECGIARNMGILKEVAKLKFKINWYPWQINFKDCLEKFVPDSERNLLSSAVSLTAAFSVGSCVMLGMF